jgi:glycosyltransferase involved in cell wall biosynthesis
VPQRPSVSIVIPTFNRSALVSRAIEAALAQSVPVEVVVCDHGSTDDTPQVVGRYGDRVRYVRRETDRGPIACWRDGIENASGELVNITYDDDWLAPTFIEETLPLLTNDVAFVYTRARVFSADNASSRFILEHPAGTRPIRDVVQYLLRTKLTISPGCALFRRRDVLKNLLTEVPGASGIYGKNSGVGEDLLLFLLTALHYPKYAHVPKPLANFLAHESSITVNAEMTGKAQALADAYAVAKQYYLQQPGSFAAERGVKRWLSKRRWNKEGRKSPTISAQDG